MKKIIIYIPMAEAETCNTFQHVTPICPRSSFGFKLFVHLHLIIGILLLRMYAHLTVLLLLNPVSNLTFSLMLITSTDPHSSAPDFKRFLKSFLFHMY